MSIQGKMLNSMKWSSITEIISKLITPITNMILARILAPEAFGILATVVMVISFAEIFVESGFQRFLIQHEFKDERQEHEFASVAFWSNLTLSMVIWLIIILFNNQIATLAGGPELGSLIAITGVTIPLYGSIGIQNYKLKKELEFKKLFYVRMVTSLVPLVITIPLALLGLEHWALIIGNISGITLRSVSLIILGRFKPLLMFSFSHLKIMFRAGIWTMLDGIAMWLTMWIDSFLIAQYMTDYYLGLYKNSVSMINSLLTLVTAAVTPVLFSSLSKLQNDEKEFNNTFLGVQKILCIILLPMAVGVFFYRDLATDIMFGKAWDEAAEIVGIITLTTVIRTIFVSNYSSVYRAKGKFYIPFVLELCGLFLLVPICSLAVKNGFWSLVYARSFLKLDLIIPNMIICYFICHISPSKTLKNVLPAIISTLIMSLIIILLQSLSSVLWWSCVSIIICVFAYFAVLLLFKNERRIILNFIKNIKKVFLKSKNKARSRLS